jgi:disulfide bond formation protein DsbB
MLKQITPYRALILMLIVSALTIGGAWVFEYAGYAPCDLCLKQRWAYYAAIPFSLVVLAIGRGRPGILRSGLVVLALLWIASTLFGVFHSGVEWGWWPGPSSCTGTGGFTGGLPDLSKPVVMCDKAAIRIFGLSLAGWNAVISLAMTLLALLGLRNRRQGSSSVSQ